MQQPVDLGRRLAAARAYAGIGQEEMARKLGVERNTIRRWERQHTRPNGAALRAAIAAYAEASRLPTGFFLHTQFSDAFKPYPPESTGNLDSLGQKAVSDLGHLEDDDEPPADIAGDA